LEGKRKNKDKGKGEKDCGEMRWGGMVRGVEGRK
jgi:hypothetical protein